MAVQVGLVFLRHEKEEDYNWALNYLHDIMNSHRIQAPLSIVTDRELALIYAVNTHFSSSHHLLCRWHGSMNVLAQTKRYFPAPTRVNNVAKRHPYFQEFLHDWNNLIGSVTKSIYNQRLLDLRAKYPKEAVKYCEDTWLIWKENLLAFYINKHL